MNELLNKIETSKLIEELILRGANLMESEAYGKQEIICKSKYSRNKESRILGRVLVLDNLS